MEDAVVAADLRVARDDIVGTDGRPLAHLDIAVDDRVWTHSDIGAQLGAFIDNRGWVNVAHGLERPGNTDEHR